MRDMIGERIGSYRILRPLGEGGMGTVYLAEHEAIGHKAAIKLLLPELSTDAIAVNRIFNEARTAATIRHPSLVDVYDFGTHVNGRAYFVMEYLDGETLGAYLRREKRLGVPMATVLGRQIASAVGAVHGQGIIHRDLKPDNIFLVADEEVAGGLRARVLDFGIAKLVSDTPLPGIKKTRTGTLMGTPIYMSPEQCRGVGGVDRRADIYALGCILFEMLAGAPPFEAVGAGELIAAHIYEVPPLLSERVIGLPPAIEALVATMLAKDPSERPQTMEAVIKELTLIRATDDLSGAVRAPADAAAFHTATTQISGRAGAPGRPRSYTTLSNTAAELVPSPTTTPIARTSRRPVLIAALAVAAVVVGIGAAVSRGKSATGAAGSVTRASPGATTPVPPTQVLQPSSPPTGTAAAAQVADPHGPSGAAADEGTAPVSGKVVLRIGSEPPGASVFQGRGGGPVGTTPLEVEIPAAPGTATFVLKRPGYLDARIELPSDRPSNVITHLTRRTTTGATPKAGAARSIADGVLDPFDTK